MKKSKKDNQSKIKMKYRMVAGQRIALYDLGYKVDPLKLLAKVRAGK